MAHIYIKGTYPSLMTINVHCASIETSRGYPFNSRLYCSLFVKVLSKSSVKYEKERLTLCFANKHVCFVRVLYICNTAIGGEDERNCNNNQQQVGNNNQNDNVTNSVTIYERKRNFVRSKFMQTLCVPKTDKSTLQQKQEYEYTRP